jgi:predicted MFS family arabinose efflux permease
MSGFLTFVPLHALALGLDGAGPALAVFGLVVILLRLFGAKLPDRLGPLRLGGSALVCSAVGLLLIGVLPGLPGLLVGTAVFAVGIALTMPAVPPSRSAAHPPTARLRVRTSSVFLDLFGFAPVVLLRSRPSQATRGILLGGRRQPARHAGRQRAAVMR